MATNEFKWDYKAHKSKHINVDLLDAIMEEVATSKTTWGKVIAGIKIFIFFAYLWARKRLIDEKFMMEKQDFEQQTIAAGDEIIHNPEEHNAIHNPPRT